MGCRLVSCIFTVVPARFGGASKLDQAIFFVLLEPAFNGSLGYRKSDSHVTSSLARVGLNVGKKTIYTDICSDIYTDIYSATMLR